MATTGRMPCVARPPANVTAWPSAMPTSKNRPGCFFWKTLVPGARRHRGGDRHQLGMLVRQRGEPVAEHLGPGGRAARLLASLARDRIVRREPVPLLLVRLGVGEALPLLRHHVDHPGAVHPAHELQRVAELAEIVPVDRAEVAESELLEQHPRREQILDALLDVLREVHHALAEDAAERERHALDLLPQPVGPRVGHDPAERLADRAHVGRDAHAVVVDDDDDVAVGVAGVVHPLVGEPAGEGAVAHDRHDLVALALEVARGGHAERGRHRGAGVPRAELVVLALVPLEEAGNAVALAQRRERLVPAGEELPGVGLVAHVPDDLVGRRVELVEQGEAQLHHAEAGADVPAGDRAAFDQAVTDLLGELGELLALEALEVGGGVDGGEQGHRESSAVRYGVTLNG